MADFITVVSSALPSTTRVLSFRGTEAISALYQFQLHLLIEDPAFDMAAALGAGATLSFPREDAAPFEFHGILATIETIDDLARGAVYRAVLVPRVWQLTQTRHSRVYVKQTIPAIVEEILKGAGLTAEDYALQLSGTYGPIEHVCQYRESNFEFIARRMEREGIYYFFEQGDTREKLVVTDDLSVHKLFSDDPVRYTRVSGVGSAGDLGLRSFVCKHTTLPGSVHLRDNDYLRPALDVTGHAVVSSLPGEVHLHGESFLTPEEGNRLARIRAEELKARQVVFRGTGSTFLLRSGYTFALQDHPRPNVDGDYLAIEVTHTGSQLGGYAQAKELLGLEAEPDQTYRVEVVAIPRTVQFRPERRTPTPRIYGTERAVIDGDADHDYAQLDEHGRYLVKLQCDESPARGSKASTRVRMMQPHGGNPESFHFPLRKGTEVLLTFEGGDPDRPVIAGVVPNVANPTLVTSKNSTKNIIMTGGGNRIVIEDEKGKEYIHFATPHLGTYMHMGSTFNPQYNKITNTAGTSLSFTSDISTSFTGTDAQTVVEDARVTIIGRARITGSDPTGLEIKNLLASDFIERFDENSVVFTAIFNDATKAAGDVSKLTSAASAAAATNPPDPAKLAALQEAIDVAATDLSTLYSDAQGFAKSTPTGYQGPPAPNDWLQAVSMAANALSTAKKSADALTADPTKPPKQSDVQNVQTQVGTATTAITNATAVGSYPAPSSISTPPLPSANVGATYINLPHNNAADDPPPGGLVTNDPTAIDVLSTVGPPPVMNPGSDIKIVGGDNVTMVAQNARSHVIGTSYGLVLGGQASVVRGGQQSKVLSPKNSAGDTTTVQSLFTPLSAMPAQFPPLAFPLPSSDPSIATVAQRSEVYGDQFTWVDGSTSSTVTQGTHTRVLSHDLGHISGSYPSPPPIPIPASDSTVAQASEVYGNQFSFVSGNVNGHITGSQTSRVDKGSHSEIFAPTPASNGQPLSDPGWTAGTTAQTSKVHGDQWSWIDGNVNATITGDKTTHVGHQTTHADQIESHCKLAWKTEIASIDMCFVLKLGIATGIAASINTLKIDLTVLTLKNHPINIAAGNIGVQAKSLLVFT